VGAVNPEPPAAPRLPRPLATRPSRWLRAILAGARLRMLDRYVAGEIVRGYLLVMLVLVTVFSFLALVEELEDVGKARYRLWDACVVVALTTPRRMFDLVPVTALLGSIVALGRLASGGELVAIHAAGVSILRIGWSVLRPGMLLMVAAALLGQFVAPLLDQLAHARRSQAISATATLRSAHGFWFRDGLRFIRVGHVLDRGALVDIDLYEFDDQRRLSTFIHARRADSRGGPEWLATEVQHKIFGDEGITTRQLPRVLWKSFLTPDQVDLLVLPPQSLSFSDLYRYIGYLEGSGQDAARYRLALWQTATMPLAAGAMVVMVVPFVLGLMRVASAGQRIVVGSMIGIAFHLTSQIVDRLGLLLNVNPAVTTLAPVAGILGVAIWLLRRL
jgi:lipopolysaccharide export system permease protein